MPDTTDKHIARETGTERHAGIDNVGLIGKKERL